MLVAGAAGGQEYPPWTGRQSEPPTQNLFKSQSYNIQVEVRDLSTSRYSSVCRGAQNSSKELCVIPTSGQVIHPSPPPINRYQNLSLGVVLQEEDVIH